MPTIDPVELGIIWDRFVSIADEMVSSLTRTSFSTMVRVSADLSCMLFDSRARLVSQGRTSVPSFTGTGPATLRRMLEIIPGDPALEARFRTVVSLAECGGDVDDALRAVERTGRLADEEGDGPGCATVGSVRPMLQALAADAGVHAAFYVRGSTALVQGQRGATAERTARCVRDVIVNTRAAARRLGLGQLCFAQTEGGFGTLAFATSEAGAGAVWTRELPSRAQVRSVGEIAGEIGAGGTSA